VAAGVEVVQAQVVVLVDTEKARAYPSFLVLLTPLLWAVVVQAAREAQLLALKVTILYLAQSLLLVVDMEAIQEVAVQEAAPVVLVAEQEIHQKVLVIRHR